MKKLLLLFIPFLFICSSTKNETYNPTSIYFVIHPLTDVTKFKRLFLAAQVFNPNNADNTFDYTLDMINPFTNNILTTVISPLPLGNPTSMFFLSYTKNLYTIKLNPYPDLSPAELIRFIIYAYTWEDGDMLPTYVAKGSVLTKFEKNKWTFCNIYLTETGIQDGDWDSYSRCEIMKADQDCNDNNPNIHPNKYERNDNIDNDCDGVIDEIMLPEHSHPH